MSDIHVHHVNSSSETITNGVASGALRLIGLATAHTEKILGTPTIFESNEAAHLLSLRETQEQRNHTFSLIASVLERVGALTPMLKYSLQIRLGVSKVSIVQQPGMSRVNELFGELKSGKIIPRSELTSALGIGDYTLTGYISALRDTYFPKHIFVTADSGLLLLSLSDDFIEVTRGFFSSEEQRAPTRVSIFMYVLLKMGKDQESLSMEQAFATMETLGVPVRKKDALISMVKTLFANKGFQLERVGQGSYSLSQKKS